MRMLTFFFLSSSNGKLFDALATTQRARRSSHGSSSLAATTTNAAVGSPTPMPELYLGTEPPTTGCIACNSAIASHLPLPLSSHEGVGVHLVVPSPPRSPAPSASSSRSRSRPSSIASNVRLRHFLRCVSFDSNSNCLSSFPLAFAGTYSPQEKYSP